MTETVSRPPGAMAAGIAAIAVGFGQAANRAASMEPSARRAQLAQLAFQVPLVATVAISGGAGAAQFPDTMGPGAGFYWCVRRLSVQGYTAGSVTIYRNAPPVGGVVIGTPEVFMPVPQAGNFFLGKSEGMLNPTDALTISATGITLAAGYAGIQVNGTADCFPSWLLPDYIGIATL